MQSIFYGIDAITDKYHIDKFTDTINTNINRINYTGFPKYIPFTTGCSGIGVSGLVCGPFQACFLGTLLLLVNDDGPLEMALGGWAGVADSTLFGVIVTCLFTIHPSVTVPMV